MVLIFAFPNLILILWGTLLLTSALNWNKLAEDVKMTDNVNIFKSKLGSIQL